MSQLRLQGITSYVSGPVHGCGCVRFTLLEVAFLGHRECAGTFWCLVCGVSLPKLPSGGEAPVPEWGQLPAPRSRPPAQRVNTPVPLACSRPICQLPSCHRANRSDVAGRKGRGRSESISTGEEARGTCWTLVALEAGGVSQPGGVSGETGQGAHPQESRKAQGAAGAAQIHPHQ